MLSFLGETIYYICAAAPFIKEMAEQMGAS